MTGDWGLDGVEALLPPLGHAPADLQHAGGGLVQGLLDIVQTRLDHLFRFLNIIIFRQTFDLV